MGVPRKQKPTAPPKQKPTAPRKQKPTAPPEQKPKGPPKQKPKVSPEQKPKVPPEQQSEKESGWCKKVGKFTGKCPLYGVGGTIALPFWGLDQLFGGRISTAVASAWNSRSSSNSSKGNAGD